MSAAATVVERTSRLPFSARTVFAWHERPGAFERLTPPWERAEVLERSGGLRDGARVVLRVGAPLGLRWVVRHRDYEPGRQFVDEQQHGPFSRWTHLHRFEPDGPDACLMTDRIEYALPLRVPIPIRARLERMLAYRHELLARDLEAHAHYADRPRLRVAVSGASGTIGRALVAFLTTGGHTVVPLVRGRRAQEHEAAWNYELGRIDAGKLAGVDAVIHLAGENVGARWTAERRRRIRDSRGIGTRFLSETLARLPQPPGVLVSASAVGIYGNRGDEALTEASSTSGPSDFLTEVGREWEAATEPARAVGMRVVLARFGIVLTPAGGALARMLPPFRLGLGGPFGRGRQWMSWIGIDDLVGAIHHALMTEALVGPVNVTAPHPVTNREFATTLGLVLERPAVVPVPAAALRLALGEMADVALLSSARVLPARLQESGYAFRHPVLEDALRFVLGRPVRAAATAAAPAR